MVFIVGTFGSDTRTGSNAADTIIGLNGNDILNGLGGPDALFGGGGNDTLNGGSGVDVLAGGSGNDRLNGGAGVDVMLGGAENDTYVVTNFGEVFEERNAGLDTVRSSIGFSLNTHIGVLNVENLILTGTALFGAGNGLNNRITGNASANTLNGLAGNDTLTGGLGADSLNGGAGADQYNYDSVAQAQGDFIRSFSRAQGDKIDLSTIDADTTVALNQAFTFIGSDGFTAAGQLRFVQQGTDTLILGNVDADLAAEFTIRVDPVVNFIGTDFFL